MTEPRIGTQIARRRHTLGLTQAELAARVGYSRSHIENIEHGRVLPSVILLALFVEALQCRVEDIFDGTIDSLTRRKVAAGPR